MNSLTMRLKYVAVHFWTFMIRTNNYYDKNYYRCNKGKNVVSNRAIDADFVSSCNNKEAYTCMFLHAKHAALNGISSINIVSLNIDIVIIVVLFLMI